MTKKLVVTLAYRVCGANFFERGAPAFAHRGIAFVLTHVGREIPAALELRAFGFLDLDMHAARAVAGAFGEVHGGDDEEVPKLVLIAREHRIDTGRRGRI